MHQLSQWSPSTSLPPREDRMVGKGPRHTSLHHGKIPTDPNHRRNQRPQKTPRWSPPQLTTPVLTFADVQRNLTSPISGKAICAVQIVLHSFPSFKRCSVFETYGELLWKISDSYFTKRQFEEALSWSLLAHHGLLDQSTPNDAKIVRRIIRCLVELQRPGEANDYFPQIRETPAHALTFVLQFQVAVRCNDELLGPVPVSTSCYGAILY